MNINYKDIVVIVMTAISISGCKNSPEVLDTFLNVPEYQIETLIGDMILSFYIMIWTIRIILSIVP